MTASEPNAPVTPEVDPAAVFTIPGGIEVSRVAPPLFAVCVARVGQSVVIHIAGGMQVEGFLEVVDEDDMTVVVTDNARRYDVAIDAMAVVEGARAGRR